MTNGYNTGTSTTRTATTPVSKVDTTLAAYTGVTIGVTISTAARSAQCNATAERAITTGGSATNISVNFASVTQPTSQFITQQSTTGTSDSKRSSKVKSRGANPAYKRLRAEKPRTAGFRVLFGANGSVIKRSGTTDTVLHSAILKISAPTNIDLGYKPNGLRWKGGTAVTQRQLQDKVTNESTLLHALMPLQAPSPKELMSHQPRSPHQALMTHSIS
ncbi:hypothetical protein R3W88_024448 [Solanum pinnatisectum]|uniref:Uncharacterized protein n=1 Tax=Solanum pinnatisectum TaxID=50273 RepID=A0AAV9M3D3_9SOLN|nr:hypothetical protein R3W88_024448 [Solanum pinnatisectum]